MDKQSIKTDECGIFSPLSKKYSSSTSTVNVTSPKLKNNNVFSECSVSWFVEPYHCNPLQKCEIPQNAKPSLENGNAIHHLTAEEEVAICEFFPATLGHAISHMPTMQTNMPPYRCCSKKEYFSLIPPPSLRSYNNILSNYCLTGINNTLKKQNTNVELVESSVSEGTDSKYTIDPHMQTESQCLLEGKLNEPSDGLQDFSILSNEPECMFSPSSDGDNTSTVYQVMSSHVDDNVYISLHLDEKNTSQNSIIHEQMQDLGSSSLNRYSNDSTWKICPPVSPFCYYFVKLKYNILSNKEKYLLLHRRFLELERLRAPKQKWYEIQDQSFHDEARRYATMELNTKLHPKIQRHQQEVLQSVLSNSPCGTIYS